MGNPIERFKSLNWRLIFKILLTIVMGEKKSQRVSAHRSVLDNAQRKLRLKRFIDSLDKNNLHEDLNIKYVVLFDKLLLF